MRLHSGDNDATADALTQAGSRSLRLLCRTGAHLWALPLRQVLEVMRVLPIKPVAGAPPYIAGLSIIRGAALPVVDIGLMVSGAPTHIERLIAVRTGSRAVALAAEAVPGVLTVDDDSIGQLPPLLRSVEADIISAVGTRDAELMLVLGETDIVPADVLRRLDQEGAMA